MTDRAASPAQDMSHLQLHEYFRDEISRLGDTLSAQILLVGENSKLQHRTLAQGQEKLERNMEGVDTKVDTLSERLSWLEGVREGEKDATRKFKALPSACNWKQPTTLAAFVSAFCAFATWMWTSGWGLITTAGRAIVTYFNSNIHQ